MGYSYSEDNGKSWSKVKSLGKPCVMAFTSIVRLNNGDYMGLLSQGDTKDRDQSPFDALERYFTRWWNYME